MLFSTGNFPRDGAPPPGVAMMTWTVAYSIKDACKVATEANACLFILADTAEQIEPAVRLATKRLPHHERAALERMADPATRARARLS